MQFLDNSYVTFSLFGPNVKIKNGTFTADK